MRPTYGAIALIGLLVLAACGGDSTDATPADSAGGTGTAVTTSAVETSSGGQDTSPNLGGSLGTIVLGNEEIVITGMLCFFEEQPRAGLGGVFTHTAQGRGVNAAGDSIVLDLSRARAEDGTVEDDIIVDIGDPFSDDAVSVRASGPEGLVNFADGSVSASSVEVSDFGAEQATLSFDVSCG